MRRDQRTRALLPRTGLQSDMLRSGVGWRSTRRGRTRDSDLRLANQRSEPLLSSEVLACASNWRSMAETCRSGVRVSPAAGDSRGVSADPLAQQARNLRKLGRSMSDTVASPLAGIGAIRVISTHWWRCWQRMRQCGHHPCQASHNVSSNPRSNQYSSTAAVTSHCALYDSPPQERCLVSPYGSA